MAKVSSFALSSALLLSTAASMPYSLHAMAADSPVKILLTRARTQAEGGHLDIAVSTWKQVLASDPTNLEALQGLAGAEVRLGHQAEADAYIARLKKAGGSAASISQLQAQHASPSDQELLRQATTLAQSGQYSGAMAIYRKLYGNNPPAGDTALIYYDTLAALPGERKHAVDGLRKLATQFQADSRYSIALGRVLTYDAPTRQEGMTLLRRFPTDRNADDALKQAMVWNEQGQGTVSATAKPATNNLAPSTPVATTSELGIGFRSLNAGNLTAADEHFRAAEREQTHGQAHAGLGYVRMRQQDFAGAVKEFEQAKEDGDRDAGVSQALANSRFYLAMGEGKAAVDARNMEAGVSSYRSALAMKPDNMDALTALGGTLLGAGRPKEAIPYLQRAVKANANSQVAWRALFLAQSQALQQAEAIQTAEHLPAPMRTQLNNDPDFLGSLAADYSGIGDQAQSDRLLKRALALSQEDAGTAPSIPKQLQYASLLLTAKRYSTASRSYHRVLSADPQNVEAWRGAITADHLGGHDAEALREFTLMPSSAAAAAQRDIGFLSMLAGIYQSQGQIAGARETLEQALQIAPSATLQLQLAALEMTNGDKQYATELYAQIVDEHPRSTAAWLGWIQSLHAAAHDRDAVQQMDEMPDDVLHELSATPDYWQSAAAIYTSLGDKRRAVESIAQVEEIYQRRGTRPPASVELQQGWLLLQAGENTRLSRVVQQLSNEEDLAPDEQAQLVKLWGSWAQQRAAGLTRQGNREGAVALLAAGLRAFPNDIALNNALANAYLANGEPKRAVSLYARQNIGQADASICVAAIGVALSADDLKQAQVWLQSSLTRFNHDPKILEMAAQFEQQRGDPKRAAAYYRAALQATGPLTIAELTASSATEIPGNIETSPRQELLNLLTATGAGAQTQARTQGNGQQEQFGTTRRTAPRYGVSSLDTPQQADRSDYGASTASLYDDTPRQRSRSDSGRLTNSPSRSVSQYGGTTSLPTRTRSREASNLDADDAYTPVASVRDEAELGTSRRSDDIRVSRRDRSTLSGPADPITSESPLDSAYARPSQLPQRSSVDQPEPVELRGALTDAVSRREPEIIPTSDSLASAAMLDPLPVDPIQPLPPLSGPVAVVRPPLSPRQQVQQNLENIEASSSPYLGGDSTVGVHSGQPGLDKLTIFSANVEQSSMIGMGARVSVIVHPTLLEAGTIADTAAYQLGTLPLGSLPAVQTSAGVGGEVQLRTRSFAASLGSTPRGFLVQNVTGRLQIQPGNGPVTFRFDRQANEETQLSFAGLRDPGSISSSYAGNIWGGVIANAASLQVKGGDGVSGWYVQGGGQYITGKHVQTNNRIDGFAGAYWSLWNVENYGKLTIGMNFFGMRYAHNQRLYTYGNGGYFSPGAYLLSSVPITFDGHYGPKFNYRATGAVGLQAFQEDATPYFPLDAGLQSAAKNPFVAARSSVGSNYNFDGEAAYLLTPHWHAGISASFNNSYDYHNERASFYLRYALHPQSLDRPGGPTGLNGTNRTLRPLLLP